MRKMRYLTFVLTVLTLTTASAVEWRNLDAAHHVVGRKASSGYLQGKVVVVCRWDATNRTDGACREILPRMEELWTNFKSKSFVMLGCAYCEDGAAEAVRGVLAAESLSFPVYADAGLAEKEPKHSGLPSLYVVDETGLVIYIGKKEHIATQAIVQALTDMDSPKSLRQWRKFLDYEIKHLPAHAYNRLNEFRKKHPEESKEYLEAAREITSLPDVKSVASLVAFAKRAKDAPAFAAGDAERRKKYQDLVTDMLETNRGLKDVQDPRLRQEAKNALADLTWTKATFE